MSRALVLRRLAAVLIATGAVGSCTYVTKSATPEQQALERYIERTYAAQLDAVGINRIAVYEERYAVGSWQYRVTVKYREGHGTEKAIGLAPDRPGGYVPDRNAEIVNCRSRFSGLVCLVRGRGLTVEADIDPMKLTPAQGEAWMDAIVESAIDARRAQRQAKAEWSKVGAD